MVGDPGVGWGGVGIGCCLDTYWVIGRTHFGCLTFGDLFGYVLGHWTNEFWIFDLWGFLGHASFGKVCSCVFLMIF